MTERCFGCGEALPDGGRQLYSPDPDRHGNPVALDAHGCDDYPDCIDDNDGDEA